MKKVLLSFVVILCALSCQKDISTNVQNPGIGIPKLAPTPVNGSVAGIVVNENNQPVSNAQVTIAGSVFNTDNKGFFSTGVLPLDKYISTVKVTMPGYYNAFRSFSANATKNYVSIKLVPKVLAGSFSSATPGNITLTNGSGISFQANSINVKSSGAAYSGMVKVFATYIDPTSPDISNTIPGSLMAEDATNFYVLRSTGMMAVELESATGEALQLVSAKPATMKLMIAASVLSKAPATIDTWSLDGRGIWIKEGTAVKNGNMYEFPVSHFSFWNCDVPINAVYLNLNVKNQAGINLVNTHVSLTSSTTFGARSGFTDSLGNVSGMVPKDEVLEMYVFASNYFCNVPFYTQNIGPFATNTSLNIVAPLTAANTLSITGTAVNCAGAPLQNGTIMIYTGMYTLNYYTITNGTFNITLPTCSPMTSVDIIVKDNTTQQQSATVTVPLSGNTFNAGTVSACGISTTEFINYSVDGANYTITNAGTNQSLYAYNMGTSTSIFANNQMSSNNRLSFVVNGGSVGTYPILSDSLVVNNLVNPISQPGGTATFSIYGPVNQYLEGSFNIPFTASSSAHLLTGTFRMKRFQ